MAQQRGHEGVVKILKLAWLGTRTDRPEPTVAFFRDVLRLQLASSWRTSGCFGCPTGARWKSSITTAASIVTSRPAQSPGSCGRHRGRESRNPVLENPDPARYRAQQERQRWVHFRAPDGNIYGVTSDPEVSRGLS